jgi:hypothetical protein
MAEKDPTMGGLGGFGNINTYGMSREGLEDYHNEIEKNIGALEQRYAQPNWFKIAAGFAKPQLGGFLASLGSAAEAHGDTVEQQRAMGLPIAKMRTELAQTGLLLTGKKKASEIAERARRENRNLTPQEQEEISNLDPQLGQMLTQAQDVRAKTVANNRENTLHNYKVAGLPPPRLNEMGLPETGNFPTGGGQQNEANPARVMPTMPSNTTTNTTTSTLSGGPAPVEVPVTTTVANKPVEKIELKTPGSEFSSLNPSEFTKAGNERLYTQLDEQGAEHIKRLKALGGDAEHQTYLRPIKDVLKYSADPRFEKVMGILDGQGLISGLATLIQKGINGSVGDFHAALAIPLDEIARSTLPKEEKAFAQNLFRALAQMELNNQKAIGLNPSSARNAEFGLLANASAHPDTLPSAARLYAKQSELAQLRNRDLYTDIQDLVHNRHKKYTVDQNSPTKMYLYMTSPSQQRIVEQYDKAYDNEMERYLKATGGGR